MDWEEGGERVCAAVPPSHNLKAPLVCFEPRCIPPIPPCLAAGCSRQGELADSSWQHWKCSPRWITWIRETGGTTRLIKMGDKYIQGPWKGKRSQVCCCAAPDTISLPAPPEEAPGPVLNPLTLLAELTEDPQSAAKKCAGGLHCGAPVGPVSGSLAE